MTDLLQRQFEKTKQAVGFSKRDNKISSMLSDLLKVEEEKVEKWENFWGERNLIPLGLRKHPDYYDGDIGMGDILTLQMDDPSQDRNKREANNILILERSGGGKSKLAKLMWFFLQKAGNNIVYIDPKTFTSGRAKIGWENDRMPPRVDAEGIPLVQYAPKYLYENDGVEAYRDSLQPFNNVVRDLDDFNKWRGLGFTMNASMTISKLLEQYEEINTAEDLIHTIKSLRKNKQINTSVANSALEKLQIHKELGLFGEKQGSIPFKKHFDKGESVCVSWNLTQPVYCSLQVGLMVYKINKLQRDNPDLPAVYFIFDDSNFFGDVKKLDYNYANDMISNIGNLMRSHAVNNILIDQSLSGVSSSVSETYHWKIISPNFQNISSLEGVDVPEEAIELLKQGSLRVDKDNYLVQRLLVTPDREVESFYAFEPPCNHFTDVFFDNPKISKA